MSYSIYTRTGISDALKETIADRQKSKNKTTMPQITYVRFTNWYEDLDDDDDYIFDDFADHWLEVGNAIALTLL